MVVDRIAKPFAKPYTERAVFFVRYELCMSVLSSLLWSLLLASIFSFLMPILLLGILLISLAAIGQIPGLDGVRATGLEQILHFLSVFGSGSAVQGLFVISSVASLVGVLFDTYIFYRYQSLRD